MSRNSTFWEEHLTRDSRSCRWISSSQRGPETTSSKKDARWTFKNILIQPGPTKDDKLATVVAPGGSLQEGNWVPPRYRRRIPIGEVKLGPLIGSGTEKRVFSGEWAGEKVAVMEILGKYEYQEKCIDEDRK